MDMKLKMDMKMDCKFVYTVVKFSESVRLLHKSVTAVQYCTAVSLCHCFRETDLLLDPGRLAMSISAEGEPPTVERPITAAHVGHDDQQLSVACACSASQSAGMRLLPSE